VQVSRPGNQNLFGFNVVGVGYATVHRTNSGASLVVVKAYTFGAQKRIDDVKLLTLTDRVVRALRFACPTVDAVAGDHRSHRRFLSLL